MNPKLKSFLLLFVAIVVPFGSIISLTIKLIEDKRKGLTFKESLVQMYQDTVNKFKKMNYKVKILLTWFVAIVIVITAYVLLSPASEKTGLTMAETQYTAKIANVNAKQAEIDTQLKNLQ